MEMASWAKPGVKVVCVDNTGHPELVMGAVYTIIGCRPYEYSERSGGKFANTKLCVKLDKVRNWSAIPDYAVERFRPLVTKTQDEDVAMFKRIADDVPLHEMIEAGLYPIN